MSHVHAAENLKEDLGLSLAGRIRNLSYADARKAVDLLVEDEKLFEQLMELRKKILLTTWSDR